MSKGTLYGLGVGPGDPELLTLKAVRILKEADVIAVPDKGSGEKTALHIVEAYIQGKPLLPCATPMVRDQQVLDTAHHRIADSICALLEEGENRSLYHSGRSHGVLHLHVRPPAGSGAGL